MMHKVKNLPKLGSRKKHIHKGDCGRVLVLAGSPGMTGAAYLCSKAALRSGSGIVTLGIPESLNSIMEAKLTCVMTHPLPETKDHTLSYKGREKILELCEKYDIIAIGPGLSQQPETKKLILWLIKTIDRTVVIDADALNALVGNIHILNKIKKSVVITPHPGEMARLMGMDSAKDVQEDRPGIATRFAQSLNKQVGKGKSIVLVLKGSGTIVTDNKKIYLNRTGNPGMATAGAGDVLTGIIVSLIGQGYSEFEASQLGVHIHGLAGDIASRKKGELSMTASDILDFLPDALIMYGRKK